MALHGKLWLTMNGQHLGGPDRMALLASIGRHGSITQAAKAVKMSYKAAWDAVESMNNLAGEPLVERLAGGKGGGGTRLTSRGMRLVEDFRRLERLHGQFVEYLGRQAEARRGPLPLPEDLNLMQTMTMKTSARNQFAGTVTKLVRGAVNDEVTLTVVGGQAIVAIVTHDSANSLGLAPGVAAFALVKASSVIVALGDGAGLSARNRLSGTVARVVTGAVNSDVTIALPGGGTIGATVTRDSEETLALRAGMAVTAVFKASSVILGVAG
ncbi:TOBE domain-containing protein [Pseudoduganella plicata]|nr:TOBE domain-containing protein [Pseudoduganella plicata]QBQ39599.1 LysR family transcriptional regulator [Pseudoduganella plicata]